MAFIEGLEAFKGEEEVNRDVEKSTLGEADEYLAKAVRVGDRGVGSLSVYEMAVVKKHHGEDVFLADPDEKEENEPSEPETPEERAEREAQYPTDK